jgi:hypothetical protein
MAQVPAGGDAIPDDLLDLLDLGKPPFLSSGPDGVIGDTDLENTSGARHQRNSPTSVGKVVRSS